MFYFQRFSIARYQVFFYANNYLELLPITSSAFKRKHRLYFKAAYNATFPNIEGYII